MSGHEATPRSGRGRWAEASDAELLAALLHGGDERTAAWSAIVGRHSHRLYAVARSFFLDETTAEDLVQTAWLRLLERADQVRDATALTSWLCTIVRNEAIRLITRRRTVPTGLSFEHHAAATDPTDAGLLRDERAQALRLAFSRLGTDCQQLLRLLCAEPPLPYDEIALVVGRPRGSLGPTRRRCLDQLRRHLPVGVTP